MTTRTFTAVLLFAGGAAAQDVYVDYDTATAFSQIKTFQFVATGVDLLRSDPEVHRQVAESIRSSLVEAKLEEVDSGPDVYVTYHASTRERLTLSGLQFGYAYGDSWAWGDYWDAYGAHSAHLTTFTEGSLVIDVYTAENNELIWRGIATGAVSENSKRNSKTVARAIKRIAKRWQKMYPYGRAVRSRDDPDR